jgi:hypothetical protein
MYRAKAPISGVEPELSIQPQIASELEHAYGMGIDFGSCVQERDFDLDQMPHRLPAGLTCCALEIS